MRTATISLAVQLVIYKDVYVENPSQRAIKNTGGLTCLRGAEATRLKELECFFEKMRGFSQEMSQGWMKILCLRMQSIELNGLILFAVERRGIHGGVRLLVVSSRGCGQRLGVGWSNWSKIKKSHKDYLQNLLSVDEFDPYIPECHGFISLYQFDQANQLFQHACCLCHSLFHWHTRVVQYLSKDKKMFATSH